MNYWRSASFPIVLDWVLFDRRGHVDGLVVGLCDYGISSDSQTVLGDHVSLFGVRLAALGSQSVHRSTGQLAR